MIPNTTANLPEKPRILVAEDDPAFRRIIIYTLERKGWEVEAVSDGGQALNALSQRTFDCLVTDHEMPRISGGELIRRFRMEMFPSSPMGIILCTARGLELNVQSLVEQFRLATILHKPFSPHFLLKVIEQIVLRQQEPVA